MKNKINVILVDDIKFSRKVISFIINKNFGDKVNILDANNSNDVQSILNKNITINGIISDIMMPNGDGLELIHMLSGHNHKIPMIIVSSVNKKNIEKALNKAESSGVNILNAFKKPILAEDIVMSIESFMQQEVNNQQVDYYV